MIARVGSVLLTALALVPAVEGQRISDLGEDPEQWLLLDGIAAQAGDGVVTIRELDDWVRLTLEKELSSRPITSREELDQLKREISVAGMRRLMIEELEAQAGEDMGLDPTEIERMIQYAIVRERREEGAAGYLDKLLEEGESARRDYENRTRELYRYVWQSSKVGGEGPAGSRPSRDRFTRPGQLKAIFRSNRSELNPPRIRLQVLVMPVLAAGGVEAATAMFEDARLRILEGEDFGAFVEEFGAEFRSSRGLMPLTPLTQVADPRLREFAATASVGDVSEILPLPMGGEPEALVLARLAHKVEPPPPDYEQKEIQLGLRNAFSRERYRRIMAFEHQLLGRDAYMWVHPGLGPEAAPNGP